MKTVVAIRNHKGCEYKKYLGTFDDDFRIFVESEPGNALEITPVSEEQPTGECKHEYDYGYTTCNKCGYCPILTKSSPKQDEAEAKVFPVCDYCHAIHNPYQTCPKQDEEIELIDLEWPEEITKMTIATKLNECISAINKLQEKV